MRQNGLEQLKKVDSNTNITVGFVSDSKAKFELSNIFDNYGVNLSSNFNKEVPSIDLLDLLNHHFILRSDSIKLSADTKLEEKTSTKVHFMLPDFDKKEMAPQRKILVIDDQITNYDIVDGFLTVLGFKNCKNNTMYC